MYARFPVYKGLAIHRGRRASKDCHYSFGGGGRGGGGATVVAILISCIFLSGRGLSLPLQSSPLAGPFLLGRRSLAVNGRRHLPLLISPQALPAHPVWKTTQKRIVVGCGGRGAGAAKARWAPTKEEGNHLHCFWHGPGLGWACCYYRFYGQSFYVFLKKLSVIVFALFFWTVWHPGNFTLMSNL